MTSGTGKGTTAKEKGAEGQLSNLLNSVSGSILPITTELGKQYSEALTTGGVGAQIPMITAAQQQSRQATARSLQGATDQLSASGLSRTPYAGSILAGLRQQGDQTTGLIPAMYTQQFLQGAPQFAFGGLNAATSGYQGLAGLGASRDIAKGRNTASLIGGSTGGLTSSLGSAAGAAGAAAFT